MIHRVIDTFPLATLISAAEDGIVVSHVPLMLHRTRGELGTLVGHLDRHNPHTELLDGRAVVAVFHGPNCYISPTVYATSQLPTWNSINVHVRGTATVTRSHEQVRLSLVRMAERLERPPDQFVLEDTDPRVPPLLPHIVGFEIPISAIDARFKLAQEKGAADRVNAGRQLLANAAPNARELLADLLDLDGSD